MRPVRNQPLLHCQLLEAARSRCVHKQSASARDDELTREETFAQDQKRSGPGVGVVALYCAMNPHTGMRIGVGEDGRRTTEACHRSSSPSARWLLFVVKEFSNIGSRQMRSTPSRQKRRLTSGAIGNGAGLVSPVRRAPQRIGIADVDWKGAAPVPTLAPCPRARGLCHSTSSGYAR